MKKKRGGALRNSSSKTSIKGRRARRPPWNGDGRASETGTERIVRQWMGNRGFPRPRSGFRKKIPRTGGGMHRFGILT